MTTIGDLNDDLLAYCLAFAGRRGLASSALVCHRWAEVARSDTAWEAVLSPEASWNSLVFAESSLAVGLRGLAKPRSEETGGEASPAGSCARLPWPRVMRHRHNRPRAVVIDAGCGYCKYGWSTDPAPSGRIATFLEFGSMESPLVPRIQTLFRTVFAALDADPRQHPVVITEPLQYLKVPEGSKTAASARAELREAVYCVLFNRLHVPAVLSTNQAVLAAFGARRLSAVVVNLGFKATTVVPVVRGQVLPGGFGVEMLNVAATRVTGCLHHLMEYSGVPCHNMFTIRALKEKLCYVSQDCKDFSAAAAAGTRYNAATYCVPEEEGGGSYTLGPQRFMASEVLFNPMLFGLPYRGIHESVQASIQHCAGLLEELRERDRTQEQCAQACGSTDGEAPPQASVGTSGSEPDHSRDNGAASPGELVGRELDKFADVRAEDLQEALQNVVVTGGTAAIPGLAERLLTELRKELPEELAGGLRVHRDSEGYNGAWLGGKMLAQTSTFPESWCLTREQYQSEVSKDAHDLSLAVRLRLWE